jgi:hypothetical protein
MESFYIQVSYFRAMMALLFDNPLRNKKDIKKRKEKPNAQ